MGAAEQRHVVVRNASAPQLMCALMERTAKEKEAT